MQPKFDNYHDGYGAEILCPKCSGNYLHHEKVEIFDRAEDEEIGIHVTIKHQDIQINKNMKGNPSRRRHGMKIYFRCEHCDAVPVMQILQHKGQTYMDLKNEA